MSPGFNTAVPMREDVLVSPKTLMPFTYQFCLKPGPDIGWIETGITVTVKWSCNSDAVSTSFDLVYAHETTSWASLSNVVSIIVKSTLPTLPEGGVMVVRGLKGSLTPDNDAMEVHGNVVHEEDYYLSCLGRHHCSVVFRDYLQNGRMLILAALTLLTSTASRALRVYCRRLRKLPTLTLMAAASSRPRLCRLLCWCWQTSEASLLLRSLPGLSRVECEAPDALTKRTRLKQAYSLQKW